jgi:hypothetical protein
VNYDGGDMTLRCLESLRRIDWPQDRLEIVLVDNASIDGLASTIRSEVPWVRLVESVSNTGFAGGVNQGLFDLDTVDYVALLNNDAVADPGWLRPLVDAMEHDASLGAVSSKIVFAPRFVALNIESPVFVPPGDEREFGVCVTRLALDGSDVFGDTQFAEGCHLPEARRVEDDEVVCWTAGVAEVRLPLADEGSLPAHVEIELLADRDKTVHLSCGGTQVEAQVGREPTVHKVPVAGAPFDVINNVGSRLVDGGYGGDRGFLQRDAGQFEEREEVFAWCGAAVLLRTSYLQSVGLLDDRYFVYYEDTDLAWRGRLAGWRYEYIPESVVRHEHAATSREGSTLFQHYVDRNRFVTLARNAPWPVVKNASRVYLVDTAVIFRRDVIGRVRAGRGPSPGLALRRLRAYFAFLKLLSPTLRSRRRQHVSKAVRREIVERWSVPQ